MIKAHRKFKVPTMRRSSRVFLNDINNSKVQTIKSFLFQCHDIKQYFCDLFWQRNEKDSKLADLSTLHRAVNKFGITTRLSQAMAKQAKEAIRASIERGKRKPCFRKHTIILYSHFVKIEKFNGSFDYAVKLVGSGAPRLVLPVRSTKHLNDKLSQGWKIGNSIHIGLAKKRIFIDFILEKERPPKRTVGVVLGMDSNEKNGLCFSDGQQVCQSLNNTVRTFTRRQKHTFKQVTDIMGHELKKLDWSGVKLLAIENLKGVKGIWRRGKFPRSYNRRMSHWMYAFLTRQLGQICEENGVTLRLKSPWRTSQTCSSCHGWDRRNRAKDLFSCQCCGHSENSDFNAAKNLAFLGEAGVYGLRSLPKAECRSSA